MEDTPKLSEEEIQNRLKLMRDNCIFCKIIKKEIEGKIIFEDDLCCAILDINPATEGHILLLPKEHYMMFPMVPDEVLGHLSIISKYLSDLLKETFSATKDVTIYMANGSAAGQKSQHFVIHIIPRYNDDTLNFKLEGSELSDVELKSLSDKFKEKLTTLNN